MIEPTDEHAWESVGQEDQMSGVNWYEALWLHAFFIMRQVQEKHQAKKMKREWRASLLDKGYNVNAGKSKVMVVAVVGIWL